MVIPEIRVLLFSIAGDYTILGWCQLSVKSYHVACHGIVRVRGLKQAPLSHQSGSMIDHRLSIIKRPMKHGLPQLVSVCPLANLSRGQPLWTRLLLISVWPMVTSGHPSSTRILVSASPGVTCPWPSPYTQHFPMWTRPFTQIQHLRTLV